MQVGCEKLATIFSEISSERNYCEEFRRIKRTAEQREINISSSNDEVYNRPFSLQELESTYEICGTLHLGLTALKIVC